jgi:hypothetical protein
MACPWDNDLCTFYRDRIGKTLKPVSSRGQTRHHQHYHFSGKLQGFHKGDLPTNLSLP